MDKFWTISARAVILVILWAVGFVFLPTGVGPLIDIILVIAVIIIVYRLLTGRHILTGEKKDSDHRL